LAVGLFFGDGAPDVVDDVGGVGADFGDGALQVFGPQAKPGRAGQGRVAGDQVMRRGFAHTWDPRSR
jgi:hypothetical protein